MLLPGIGPVQIVGMSVEQMLYSDTVDQADRRFPARLACPLLLGLLTPVLRAVPIKEERAPLGTLVALWACVNQW